MRRITDPAVGIRFKIGGAEFEVVGEYGGKVIYAAVIGGRRSHISQEKFADLELSGRLVKIHENTICASANDITPSSVSDAEAAEMNARLAYVRGVIKLALFARSKRYAEPIIKKIAEDRGDSHCPAFSTVAKWTKDYIQSGQDPMSLVPRIRNRGNRAYRFEPVVERVIMQRIDADYLMANRIGCTQLHSNIVGQIVEELLDAKESAQMRIPGLRTIQRRAAMIDEYTKDKARHGTLYANRKHRAAGASRVVTRLLELAEADGQLLDVQLVDPETGEVLGRPYCTAILEVSTEVILAFVITLIPFCSATLLEALKLACSHGDQETPGGSFETLKVDNGGDYISDAVRAFCLKMGISLEMCAPRDPNGKPHIERFFRTLNDGLIHLLPGTTFSSPADRGDYKSQKYARVTLDKLQKYVAHWIEKDYHSNIRGGLGRVPIVLWREEAARHPPARYLREELEIMARLVVERSISKGRVRYEGLHWYSHALASLEHQLGKGGNPAKARVLINELDLSCVYVEDPRNRDSYIQADSVKPGYTRKLTIFEHEKIRARLKEQGKEDLAQQPAHALEMARWTLWQDIVTDGQKFAKKQIARLTEGRGRVSAAASKLSDIEVAEDSIEQRQPINDKKVSRKKRGSTDELVQAVDNASSALLVELPEVTASENKDLPDSSSGYKYRRLK